MHWRGGGGGWGGGGADMAIGQAFRTYFTSGYTPIFNVSFCVRHSLSS